MMEEDLSEDEIEQLDFKNDYISVIREKSCIGKNVWVYKLSKNINSELFSFFPEGVLTYPLGEKYKFFNFQSTGKFAMSGILATDEIKVVPRLSIGSEIKLQIEDKLTEFCKRHTPCPSQEG